MATTQVSQAKQIATALKSAAKMLTVSDREITKLETQNQKLRARLEAAGVAPKGPLGPKAKLAAKETKAPRAKRVTDDEDDAPKAKRGPKAGATKTVVVARKNAKTTKVAKEVEAPAKRGPKAGSAKANAKTPVKGKVTADKKPVKKARAGNDDFLLP